MPDFWKPTLPMACASAWLKSFPASMSFTCAAISAHLASYRARKEARFLAAAVARPIAISLLVKNPNCQAARPDLFPRHWRLPEPRGKAGEDQQLRQHRWHHRGRGWQSIAPDEHGDWLKQRDDSFGEFHCAGRQERRERQSCLKTILAGRGNEPRCLVLQRLQSQRCGQHDAHD